jgi:hypothetical protein
VPDRKPKKSDHKQAAPDAAKTEAEGLTPRPKTDTSSSETSAIL